MEFFPLSCHFPCSKLLRLVVVFGVLIFWSASGKSIPKDIKFSTLLVFGDSIVDPGNNNDVITPSRANYPPYGQDYPGGIPTGRFTNGKNPSDFIAKLLSIKETVPAYLDPNLQPDELITGVSFASGGCGYDPISSTYSIARPLSEQLDLFREYKSKLQSLVGEDKASDIISKSLVIVVASSNDIANTFLGIGLRPEYDIHSYTDFIANAAGDFVKELYGVGVTKVGLFSAPPLGCLPSVRTLFGGSERKTVERFNQGALLFNSKLTSVINTLNDNTPEDLGTIIFDIYNPLLELIKNPQGNGFDVGNLGCCGTGKLEVTALCSQLNPHLTTCPDPTKYIFWDSFHPTETTYELIVTRIYGNFFG